MIWKSFNSKKKTIDEESKAVEGFNQKYEDSTLTEEIERRTAWQQAVYEYLEKMIEEYNQNEQEIINKFLCQLFFLILFTNKTDIKPENILVKEDHDDVKFIHTDVGKLFIDTDDGKSLSCNGMFDIFIAHKTLNSFFNEKFLTLLWKRISSDELSKYFDEYINKYTLTQDKIKKIISRTVRNVLRQNYDIKTQTQNKIDVPKIKETLKKLFFQMKLYMENTEDLLKQKQKFQIKLEGGNDEKKKKLIEVLSKNASELSNVLTDDVINDVINRCVDEAIAKYNKQKYHPQSNINESDNKVKESDNKVKNSTTNINPKPRNEANKAINEDTGANSTNNTPTYTLCSNFCKNPYIGWDEHGNWHCCL